MKPDYFPYPEKKCDLMIGPTNTEKLVSLVLALSIQVGLGLALFSAADTGKPRPGTGDRQPGTVLVVNLIPLNELGSASGTDDDKGEAETAVSNAGKSTTRPAPRGAAETASLAQSDVKPRGALSGSPSASPPAMADLPSNEAIAWRALVQTHLAQYRLYPPGAAHDGQQGVALVQFTVDRHGNVSQAWVATSSGIASIDRETIAAILRAQPLPPFPSGWPETLDIRLPVAFRLS